MPFGSKGLIVTWSVPVPQDARVSYATSDIFDATNRALGPEIPQTFPKKYTLKLEKVDLFNARISDNSEEFVSWQKKHNVEMHKEPLAIFDKSIKKGQVIASTLVEHPAVSHPERFEDACSVVLQRAVIISDPDPERETIFLRSYFHSVDETTHEAANFVPQGGMKIDLSSKTVWFPLELTSSISEPASYLVLDILTTKPFKAKLPEFLQATKNGKVDYRGKTYQAVRITGKLAANQKWEDLNLAP